MEIFYIFQQHRNDRGFGNRRSYALDSNLNKKDINYADLQLPKTSNNGSMKKSNRHHHPAAFPRNIPPHRIDYAEIQFKPRSNEQAEV